MKTITIKQPWASLIVEGIKDVENRTWKTNFRGRVLIHASAKYDERHRNMSRLFTPEQWHSFSPKLQTEMSHGILLKSAIIGSVEIVDCVINHPSIWAEKSHPILFDEFGFPIKYENKIYNWVLANPIKFLEPIPCKGKLSFWESECEVLKCPNCGEYCLHDNRDVGMPNCGNPVHQCEYCGYIILESEFEYLK